MTYAHYWEFPDEVQTKTDMICCFVSNLRLFLLLLIVCCFDVGHVLNLRRRITANDRFINDVELLLIGCLRGT